MSSPADRESLFQRWWDAHRGIVVKVTRSFTATPADANPDLYAAYDRTMLVKALRLNGRVAPAGSAMAYANFGAAVLGEASASAWGTSYAEALRAHVLTPLKMTSTSVRCAANCLRCPRKSLGPSNPCARMPAIIRLHRSSC